MGQLRMSNVNCRAKGRARRGLTGWATAGLIGLAALPGCSVLREVSRSVAAEVRFQTDQRLIDRRLRAWAEESWQEYAATFPKLASSDDFAAGYRAGFVRFLQTGQGEPPVLPPPRYLGEEFIGRDGPERIAAFFDGYRSGVSEGERSGHREAITLRPGSAGLPGRPEKNSANSGDGTSKAEVEPEIEPPVDSDAWLPPTWTKRRGQ